MIGQSLQRTEDAALLRGQARFIDDLQVAGELHAVFVRSPLAHARIEAVHRDAALAMPGVVAVFDGAQLAADGIGPLRENCSLHGGDGQPFVNPGRPALAVERVRHVGDAVAVVVAATRAAAQDAAEQVEVDYHALATVSDAEAALRPGAAQLWDEAPHNVALDWSGGDAAACAEAFARAAHLTRLRLVNNRVSAAPMETRGVLASYDPASGVYTLSTPSQGVNHIRFDLARHLGITAHRVQVLTPWVGGAFGMKIPVYPEHVVLAWAARRCARPLRWVAERSEAFLCDGQARDHVMQAELALDAQGQFLAIRCHTVSNMGAYANGAAPVIPTAGGTRCITGVYRIGAWHARVQVVFSNTVPVVAYRGAGKPEYNYMIERLVDAAARELGIDAAELRRRNVVPPSAMPYRTGTGLEFDSGEFARNLDQALALADRAGFAARRAEAARRGRLRGFGFALFQEPDGYLDNRVTLTFDPGGGLSVTMTGQDGGMGHATTFAQVAAAQFGLELADVRIVQGDSALVGPGSGTGGSRTATVASMGIVGAAQRIIERGQRLAAVALECAEADLEFDAGAGVYRVTGTDREVALRAVVAAAFDLRNLPPDVEPGLDASCHHLARAYNYPCGCHVCELEVDPDTGHVQLLGYWAVDDHGVLINPMLLEGQLHGGTVQGIGQALHEACRYDADSAQLLTGSFMDYAMPRAGDLVDMHIEHAGVPCLTNPLGVKGVGESGCTASMPAVMNALLDALAERGITHLDMPATAQRVWAALQAGSTAR